MRKYKVVLSVVCEDEWKSVEELLKNLYKEDFRGVIEDEELYEMFAQPY